MMTLFWFILGLAIIIGVSRYNEDDNLFWKLFIAYIGSFTAASIAVNTVGRDKQEKVVVVEKAPTQVLQSMPCSFYTVTDISLAATQREKSPKPVSKDSLINNNDSILSEVFGSIRGQPFMCMYFDDS